MGNPSDETEQTEGQGHRRCDVIDIPPNSKVVGTDHWPIFYSLSMTTVTAPYKRYIFGWDGYTKTNRHADQKRR